MTAVSDSPASTATIPMVTDHHASAWPGHLWALLTSGQAREAYRIGRALRRRHLNPSARPGDEGWLLLDRGEGYPFILVHGPETATNTYRRALHRAGWRHLDVNEAARLIGIHPRRGGR